MTLPNPLKLISGLNFQKLGIYVGVAALIYGSGVATGVAIGAHQETKHVQTQVTKAEKKGEHAVAAVVKEAQDAQVERVLVKVRDLARETTLINQLDALSMERDNLKAQLDAKTDPDAGVRVRLGDLRLLDSAATGRCLGAEAGMADPACLAAHQEQAASDVSLRGLVRDGITVRAQYRELAQRHDALVDWVDRELIQPQLQLAAPTKGVASSPADR